MMEKHTRWHGAGVIKEKEGRRRIRALRSNEQKSVSGPLSMGCATLPGDTKHLRPSASSSIKWENTIYFTGLWHDMNDAVHRKCRRAVISDKFLWLIPCGMLISFPSSDSLLPHLHTHFLYSTEASVSYKDECRTEKKRGKWRENDKKNLHVKNRIYKSLPQYLFSTGVRWRREKIVRQLVPSWGFQVPLQRDLSILCSFSLIYLSSSH